MTEKRYLIYKELLMGGGIKPGEFVPRYVINWDGILTSSGDPGAIGRMLFTNSTFQRAVKDIKISFDIEEGIYLKDELVSLRTRLSKDEQLYIWNQLAKAYKESEAVTKPR